MGKSFHWKWATTPHDEETRQAYAKQIARRLIATRHALDLTQAELCRSAGVQQNTYNQYERAKNVISLKQALKLCRALKLTLDWIYAGDPDALPANIIHSVQYQTVRGHSA